MNDELRPLGRPDPDDELERMLESYARAQLTPDPDQVARMRMQLMIDANERLAAPVLAIPGPAPTRGLRGLLGRLGWSGGGSVDRPHRARLAPALLGASLAVLLLGGVAYAGSRAGGPLYPARLWLENVSLPADSTARLTAELGHLQARLNDATGAAASGNGGAVQAALDAYRATVDQAVATADGNLDKTTRLGLVLGNHQAVLRALVGEVPPQAADAIQRAIDRTEQKIQQVQDAGPGTHPGSGAHPTPAVGSPGDKPGNAQPGSGPGNGAPAVKPTKSPRP
jgi:hypothetical protein